MNKSIFLLLSLLIVNQASAQFFKYVPQINSETPAWAETMYSENANLYEVEQLRRAYYEDHDFEKTIHEQNYKHWRTLSEPYLDERGNIHLDRDFSRQQRGGGSGNWIPVGPKETYSLGSEGNIPVSWQCNIYCFDQSASNPNTLLAGVEGGDLFKSTDKGLNWFPVTETLPVSTPTAVKIAPSNENIAFFHANGSIYKTTDGGSSWADIYSISGGIHEIMIHPTDPNDVFVVGDQGTIRSTDGGANWSLVYGQKSWDIRYHATNSSIMYLLKENSAQKRAEVFKSTDGGVNWTLQDNGWYVPTDLASASAIGGKIGVTVANPDYVYVALIGESKADDNGWIGVYKSTDAAASWVNPMGQDGGPYDGEDIQNLASINRDGTGFHQGFYNFAFGVSANDEERFWVGTLSLTQSDDGGETVRRIGSYNAQPDGLSWIHPDIQDFTVQGNDIWLTCDGGINYSNDEFESHESRKFGIHNSTYWGFGQGWNEDVMVGGRYHNGNSGYYQTYGVGNTLRLGGGESPTGHVNPLHDRKSYFNDVTDRYIPETLDGPQTTTANMGLYPTGSYWTSESSELAFDPRYANHLYLGSANSFWKSTNEGALYESLNSFSGTHIVREIEISREDPNVIYCVVRGTNTSYLSRSDDGGITWNNLSNLPTGNPGKAEISINPEDSDELWMIVANADYVYRTTDGGSNWSDMTTAVIEGEQLKDIKFQGGSEVVYVASNTGVWYWEAGTWVPFMTGLPARLSTYELEIFYRDGKIRLCDKGKGIWESDLAVPSMPLAQPMTTSDRVYCSRDTVEFDCHSILNHNGATWLWSFDPQPAYVSTTNVRSPKVYFGGNGSYDVSLTVTDGNGNSSTKTELGMITVESLCEVDTVPGMAMESTESGGYASIPALDVSTNTFTITAWVKPDGIQPDYSGIVMANGSSAGINFRGGNNSLGYHWPGGGQWWWDSGLIVPEEEWSYVAMVVTPDDITLYLNGIPSSQSLTMSEAEIGSLLIGSYQNWGSRYYTGQIDEVRIWNRSLSQDEIRELRHVTLTQEMMDNDPDLLVYYQFNEEEGAILDRKGVRHASLAGIAERISSDGPFAKGDVDRLDITSSGSSTFTNSESSIEFAAGSTVPDGEVVFSRLHVNPNELPNGSINFDSYFVLNNYGSNETFDAADHLTLKPFAFNPNAQLLNGEWTVDLHDRASNEHLEDWAEQCTASSVSASGIVFDSECGITGSGQLFPTTNQFVAIEKPIEPSIQVYPNPVVRNGQLTLNNSYNEQLRLVLYNASGKVVKSQKVLANEIVNVELDGFSAGVYNFSLQGTSFIKNGRVVVQ